MVNLCKFIEIVTYFYKSSSYINSIDIAIKFLLSYTDDAEEVKEYFGAQLSQRERCRWQKNDEKEQLERKMKEEAEKAKNAISVSNSPRTNRRTKSTWEKLTR